MSRSATSVFPAITVEGSILSAATLDAIARRNAGEQAEADYGIRQGLSIRDEISLAFRVAQAHVQRFERQAEPGSSATARFIQGLLSEAFGFDDLKAVDHPLAIAAGEGRVPVVVVPPGDSLDRASEALSIDRRRSAAFALQDHLNDREEALWGLATNGTTIRLMRDNASLTRPAWLEADLPQMVQTEDIASFALLWLTIHRSRFGQAGTPATDCALERWRDAGTREGEVARDKLADQVEQALRTLGSGFLAANPQLRGSLTSGALPLTEWFNELLRLVYRLIFIMVAEDRQLLHSENASTEARELYARGYALSHLRELAVRRAAWDRHHDRYEGVKVVFRALASGEPELGLPALGGLFAEDQLPHLEDARLPNRALLEAIYRLGWLREKDALVPVNWRAMETEELGSVYESLLELQPQLTDDGRMLAFAQDVAETKGNQRKTTGSYYTPDSLVQALLDTALDPVLDRTEAEAENPAEALLELTVVDPACGSGHFLLAAARRIATRVARHRAEGTPSAADFRHALRDVAGHCLHGVDRNPMAVELTRVALWIETVDPGLPLGFFDAQIRCGDALLGVFDRKVLQEGIPDAAYKPLTGDDKDAAKYYLKANRDAKSGQGRLGVGEELDRLPTARPYTRAAEELRLMPENSVRQVEEKRRRFHQARKADAFCRAETACDIYIAAFLMTKTAVPSSRGNHSVPISEDVWGALQGNPWSIDERHIKIARDTHAFHWPLEFPDVMTGGGFDVVIGNPPYISAMEYARHFSSRQRAFIQKFFISAKGAFDLYIPFIELASRLANRGVSALLTPNKFLSAPYGKQLRSYVTDNRLIHSLDDFSHGVYFRNVSVYPIIMTLRGEGYDNGSVSVRKHIDGETYRSWVTLSQLAQFPGGNLGALLSDDVDRLVRILENTKAFSQLVDIGASTTAAEADAFSHLVREMPVSYDSDQYWKVVNTGTIDPYRILWGKKELRNSGESYLRPTILKTELIISERRRAQYDSPKLIFAKIGNRPEVFFDELGEVAALNVNFAFCSGAAGKFYLAYLNSDLASWVYRQLFGALAMSGGYLQFQAPQIREMPVPSFDADNELHSRIVSAANDVIKGVIGVEQIEALLEDVVLANPRS